MLTSVQPCRGPSNAPPYFRITKRERDDISALISNVPIALLLGVRDDDAEAISGPSDHSTRIIVAGPEVITGINSLSCDFSRTELPLDLEPSPHILVAHYSFKTSTDLQLPYRFEMCVSQCDMVCDLDRATRRNVASPTWSGRARVERARPPLSGRIRAQQVCHVVDPIAEH